MVHGTQTLRALAPIPPEGVFRTVGRIEGLYDLKRLAQAVITTRTKVGAVAVSETVWTLIFMKDGGFGGPRPKKTHGPKFPSEGAPLVDAEEATTREQALLYRLSGDTNPLHADPEFARAAGFDEPILHGLATYGFVARAVIRGACEGDSARLRTLTAQFKKPVYPGQALRTVAYRVEAKLAIRAYAGGGSEPVLEGWAEVDLP
jgi:acyl dehydratase